MEPFKFIDEPIPHFTLPAWTQILSKLSLGFSTRIGGESKGYYDSLNLALHINDDERVVIANRQKLASVIGFNYDAWTSAEQVHGNRVEIVTIEERGKGRYNLDDAIKNADGIVTNSPDILLTSFYADCVPLYFFDPVNKVIGLAHAGWKGTVLKIGEQMINTMKKNFNSNINDIKTAIGPSIDQCCYEVNDQVIRPLKESITNIPEIAIIDKKNGHYDLDLKKINQQIFLDAGILPENIEISSLCTSCEEKMFFSHRRDKGHTGRMISWIGLRKDE